MSKCSSCKKDFIPLLKNNGLPYKTCDRCRSDDKKYKDTHKEQIKVYDNQYRELNKEMLKEKEKQYFENNKDIHGYPPNRQPDVGYPPNRQPDTVGNQEMGCRGTTSRWTVTRAQHL